MAIRKPTTEIKLGLRSCAVVIVAFGAFTAWTADAMADSSERAHDKKVDAEITRLLTNAKALGADVEIPKAPGQ